MSVEPNGAIGLRAIVTPAVVWIWVGVFVMVAGTVLCLLPPQSKAAVLAPGEESVRPAEATV